MEDIKIEREVINGNNVACVDVKEVWAFLEIKQNYSDWFDVQIRKHQFRSFNNYIRLPAWNPNKSIFLMTIGSALLISTNEKSPKGTKLSKILNDYIKQYFDGQYSKECEKFAHLIKNMFSEHEIRNNFPVPTSDYVLDWYIPGLKLAIEIEDYKEKAASRRTEIEKILNCKFAVYNVNLREGK